MHIQQVLHASLALATSALAAPQFPYGSGTQFGLWDAMRARGRSYIGTALTIRDDAKETAIISNKHDFNSVTPENAMKWDATEPSRNNFTFEAADQIVQYAAARNYDIHCHTLVWYSQLPTWVSGGEFDNATLIEIMQNHITTLMERYRGHCTQWDVVNEALNDDGTYRENIFYTTIGEAYIPIAFQTARKADPHAQLFYNDYNLESNGAKTAGAQRLVKLVQQYGGDIQGVGFQGHLTSEPTPSSSGGVTPSLSTLTAALKSLTDSGVDVAYTELDVRFNLPANSTDLQQQKECYERVAASCLATPRCIGITTWGVTDKYSWIPGTFAGEGDALMWNSDYQKKPAYYGFLEGILTGGLLF